jgi:hypothetical protein
MTDLEKAARQALDALEYAQASYFINYAKVISDLRAALAQQQAEPVAYQDTLSRESQQRERLDLRLAGRKKGAHAESEFGVPHFAEERVAQQAEPVVEHPDTARLRFLYSSRKSSSEALIEAQMRLLDGESLTLEEARAAIDDAIDKSDPVADDRVRQAGERRKE